ncbi:hypothetical protein IQ268_30290 [Oculatella sp. LEGE 06141]|uniref:hypothetical protein n=1 Tax=Oculatella sp. LEGE 06141 TaxID=1828648 RepID=UPI00187FA8D3|nr:hypothetical protein [Oculatella sp. LEGE 06141]MBE9182830.1 hypothetical protein [Oculatella sp. LEGE 06141]
MKEIVLAALLLLSNCRASKPPGSILLTSYDPSPVVRWASNYYQTLPLTGLQFHGVRWQSDKLQVGLQVSNPAIVQLNVEDVLNQQLISQQTCPGIDSRVWRVLGGRSLEIWLLNEEEAVFHTIHCETPLIHQYHKQLLQQSS